MNRKKSGDKKITALMTLWPAIKADDSLSPRADWKHNIGLSVSGTMGPALPPTPSLTDDRVISGHW